MKIDVEFITPALAIKYLGDNAQFQRGVRKAVVRGYAAAMGRGEWRLTHQGIAIDVNGKLIDGQHRLLAIVEANIPVHMTVCRDVPADAFNVLDIGAKRDLGDLLHIPKREAAILSFIGKTFSGGKQRVLSSQQATQLYDEIGHVIEEVTAVSGQGRAVLTSAACQTAVTLMKWENPDNQDLIVTYKNLIDYNVENLAPSGLCLLNQIARGLVNATSERNRLDSMSRIFYVMDKERQDNNRVTITQEFTAGKIKHYREKLRSVMGWAN